MNIIQIIKEYRWGIAKIYVYVLMAQGLFMIEPYLLGKAIDQLMIGQYSYLFLLLVIFLAQNFFTYRRMVYDTKVWTEVYNKIVFDYLERDRSSDTSTKIARTEMAHNIIGFLEGELQYFIVSAISIVGSLYFIFLGSWITGLVVMMAVPPIAYIVRHFWRVIAKGTRISNSHYEQKFSSMNSGQREEVETFFKRRRRVCISQSTVQGKHWTSLNSIKSLFLIGAVFVFTHRGGLSQGEAVTMYAYINQFLNSLMSLPIAVETITRVRDVLSRILHC